MATLEQFARNMVRHGRNLDKNLNVAIIKMGGSILQAAVVATPVDEGRARGGWVVGINNPPTASGERLDVSGAKAISSGKAVLATRRTEQTIYISNNVEYIGFLNDGSSAQAPANFVSTAVKAGSRTLQGVKVIVK